jgi:hypothetical protein
MTTDSEQHPYFTTFNSSFSGILRWHQLDELWEKVQQNAEDWYIYAVGETPPEDPVSSQKLKLFIKEIDELLHKEHDEDYCGIVYADDRSNPEYIKIFDPNNVGTSCSTNPIPPLPGWILSKMKPIDLPNAFPQTGSRTRWWQKIFK